MIETFFSFYFLTILCGENDAIDKQAHREYSKVLHYPPFYLCEGC